MTAQRCVHHQLGTVYDNQGRGILKRKSPPKDRSRRIANLDTHLTVPSDDIQDLLSEMTINDKGNNYVVKSDYRKSIKTIRLAIPELSSL